MWSQTRVVLLNLSWVFCLTSLVSCLYCLFSFLKVDTNYSIFAFLTDQSLRSFAYSSFCMHFEALPVETFQAILNCSSTQKRSQYGTWMLYDTWFSVHTHLKSATHRQHWIEFSFNSSFKLNFNSSQILFQFVVLIRINVWWIYTVRTMQFFCFQCYIGLVYSISVVLCRPTWKTVFVWIRPIVCSFIVLILLLIVKLSSLSFGNFLLISVRLVLFCSVISKFVLRIVKIQWNLKCWYNKNHISLLWYILLSWNKITHTQHIQILFNNYI